MRVCLYRSVGSYSWKSGTYLDSISIWLLAVKNQAGKFAFTVHLSKYCLLDIVGKVNQTKTALGYQYV